jgi:hypothetical protein
MLMPRIEQEISSNRAFDNSFSVSQDLINILKSIRSLTKVDSYPKHTAIPGELRALCSDIQHQLHSQPSKKNSSDLEASCIYASLVYIDLILLRTPSTVVTQSEIARQLHRTIMQWRSAKEMSENGDIWSWISATASATFGVNNRQKAALIEKFDVAVRSLENRDYEDE